MSVFDALAKTQSEEERAQNRAIISARVRAQETFGAYLSRAENRTAHADRLAAISDSLRATLQETADEYMTDPDSLVRPVLESLAYVKKPKDKYVVLAAGPELGDSFQQETVDLPSAGDSGLGSEGSPKIDKGKSGDQAGWSTDPIDVGSKAHPLEQQDILDRADYNAEDFDPDSPTRTRVDADTAMQPEHNVAPNTDTWTGTEGLADAVTQKAFAPVSKYQAVTLDR